MKTEPTTQREKNLAIRGKLAILRGIADIYMKPETERKSKEELAQALCLISFEVQQMGMDYLGIINNIKSIIIEEIEAYIAMNGITDEYGSLYDAIGIDTVCEMIEG